ncbi:hypothetical protein [Streptomyces stelliscabiei]|uniref:Uncharacterized protein n=1 Tax=Streptomyces stelliscabiei TaxID=146820 RepID=A0A8I0TR81_9ACTN|nr:hypothetical protein [Streptomyces stelliscabiei]KND45367.1 hypothetical protein IQ64_07335 [Streptomyces stelliscabiei]MBE1597217.1 hypothetical protein [Streptomyces stelliscabiei]MDX2550120.1 hypothetical protein [Streptomyces stelliscabiei]
MSCYAVQERKPHGQLLSWNGRVIVHNSRDELEFLLTGDIRIVDCPRSIPPEQTIELRFHPQFSHHRFPLCREDYP